MVSAGCSQVIAGARCFIEIGSRLEFEGFGVVTPRRHQLVVTTQLNNAAVTKYPDPISPSHCREPVGDYDNRSTSGEGSHPVEEIRLGVGIERRRRFVEDKEFRIAEERPSE